MSIDRKAAIGGFTLIELSISTAIIGLLAAGALSLFSAQYQQSRINSTKDKIKATQVALQTFISANGRLPCPAIPSMAPVAAGYGIEIMPSAIAGNACPGATAIGGARGYAGTLPWRSLGLSDDAGADAWQNLFHYQVSESAINNNGVLTDFSTIQAMFGTMAVYSAVPLAGQLNLNNPAAVVILSRGLNGLSAYNKSGTAPAVDRRAASPMEMENANDDNNFILGQYSDDSAIAFDDLVWFLSPAELLIRHGTINRGERGVINREDAGLGWKKITRKVNHFNRRKMRAAHRIGPSACEIRSQVRSGRAEVPPHQS